MKSLSVNELMYKLTRQSIDIVDTIESLEGFGVYRNKMKRGGNMLKDACLVHIDDQFKDNEDMVSIHAKDVELPKRVDELMLCEKIAVNLFVDQLIEKRK